MRVAPRRRRWWPRALLTILLALAVVAPPTAASSQSAIRVGVVVDLGNGTVKKIPVTMSGSSTTGVQVLQAAALSPTLRGFGGIGQAVCALTVDSVTLGCPADNTCLICAQPAYWAYSRAVGGASSFTTSPVGAGATTVHDGDVEAWRWGTGVKPNFVGFSEFFPAPPPSTNPPPTNPPATNPPATNAPNGQPTVAPPGTGANNGGPAVAVRPGATPTATDALGRPVASSTPVTNANGTPRVTTPGATTSAAAATTRSSTKEKKENREAEAKQEDEEDGAVAAGPPVVDDPSEGTGAVPVVALGAVLLAFGGGIALARRRRARVAPD